MPPGFRARTQRAQVAAPTVSKTDVDPVGQPRAALEHARGRQATRALDLVLRAARHPQGADRRRVPSSDSAVATPPPAPWTSTVAGREPARVKSIR